MKSDRDLQKDVQDAIQWDPILKTELITIAALDGVVTLSGTVDNYLTKIQMETVVKSVYGVKAIVEHLQVSLAEPGERNDLNIATAIVHILKSNWVPGNVQVKVERGVVTLSGEVEWNFQKEAASKSASGLQGVKAINNNIIVVPKTQDQLEKRLIEHALLRYSSTADQNIRVKVSGSAVTLSGTVYSIYQKEEAEKISWNTPGVQMVTNELTIELQ